MMGGIGPTEAGRLTYWQYTAMRHVWNERPRSTDEADDDIEAPTPEFVRERMAALEAAGISGTRH